MSKQKKYGFFTSISMVIGIVIGCGIEFKADDVLVAVNGNVLFGVMGFLIVGIGVLFGALTIAEYALQDEEYTGVIGYAKKAVGPKFAYIVGWFSMVCYYPACIVVLAMVTGLYLEILLGIDSAIFLTISTLVFLLATFIINICSPKGGGIVQIMFTIIKLIPLIVIGVIGTLFFTGQSSNIGVYVNNQVNDLSNAGAHPLSALIAIAFAFDGWIVATNIARELKGNKKTLSRALAIGTTIIIILYVLYFFGITQIVNPTDIMQLGDAHTELAAETLLGPIGGKLITAFVVISVYGGLNGMVLGYLRIPKNFYDSGVVKNTFSDKKEMMSKKSLITCVTIVGFYFIFQQLLDYQIIFANLETGFDLSVLPIMINYIFYIILFIMVNKLVKEQTSSKRLYFVFISTIATISGFLVVYGTLGTNGLIYIIFSIIAILIGIPFYNKQIKAE